MIPEEQKVHLPAIRQELRIEPGRPEPDGRQTWLVVDPVQHRYVQIGESAYQMLSMWKAGLLPEELARSVRETFNIEVTAEQITRFASYLAENNLTVAEGDRGWRTLVAIAEGRRQGGLAWLIHNYLLIRIPLVRPEPFLRRTAAWVGPVFSRAFFAVILIVAALGLYLVSRQWDMFLSTFQYFFSVEGAIGYFLALCFVKSAHELGHAYTAARYGCRVPSMGICFIVLFPMLYTDVTDAWRLTERKKRLAIGAAGIIVELCLAAIATFMWAFLPEGPVKSVAFFVATTGWVLSLLINLNPLMRFDGYYLFCDALGVDNLQTRAFALGRWRLRELLFGFGEPPPETYTPRMSRTMIAYAWATWIYRLILFTGIALLIYHMTFKVLGIFLFAVEIIFFIARPIWSELKFWSEKKKEIAETGRSKVTVALVIAAVIVFVWPWPGTVRAPAVLETSVVSAIYPDAPGLVVEIKVSVGDRIEKGQPLVRLTSDDVENRLQIAQRKERTIKMRLARRVADDMDRSESMVLEKRYSSIQSEIAGLRREIDHLTIKAPEAGILAELNPELHVGRSIGRAERIGLVRGTDNAIARGYVAETDLARLSPNANAVFIPDNIQIPILYVSLINISQSDANEIEQPELASVYGGPIAVQEAGRGQSDKELLPVQGQYLVLLRPKLQVSVPDQSIRGVVKIDGQAQSYLHKFGQAIASVLIRESGF